MRGTISKFVGVSVLVALIVQLHLARPVEAVPSAPLLESPPNGLTMPWWEVVLQWRYRGDFETQYRLQVVPYNNEGPGIDLIAKATPYLARRQGFEIPSAPNWYGLLPDTTYNWRVRVGDDAAWGTWSLWRTFHTKAVQSDNIHPINPQNGVHVQSLTPNLQWANPEVQVYYYEIQVSKDKTFETIPSLATAPIYWNLIHGGVSNPRNSYNVPPDYPLEPKTTYYWRVRPRIQGIGNPEDWSETWTFATP